MARIYYVGDWAVMLGPTFVESPFNYQYKGTDVFNYGHWLKDALESDGQHEVKSVPAWEFYRLGPGQYERVLDEFDLLIFSDVEAKLFQLDPAFFDRSKFGTKPLVFPDRIRLTVEAVQSGIGVMFLGGWQSFTGEMGKGGWGRTRLKEILPVACMEIEDLVESTEGFRLRSSGAEHLITSGVDFASIPPILGYNKVAPREDCQIIARWSESDDPAIAVGQFGAGRVLAYTSDPAPHWACNFVYSEQYARFWLNACQWTLSRPSKL